MGDGGERASGRKDGWARREGEGKVKGGRTDRRGERMIQMARYVDVDVDVDAGTRHNVNRRGSPRARETRETERQLQTDYYIHKLSTSTNTLHTLHRCTNATCHVPSLLLYRVERILADDLIRSQDPP